MKAKTIIVLAVALAGLILAVGFGLKTIDKYSKLEGQYQEGLRIANANAEILNAIIAEKEKAIAAMDKKLIASELAITDLTMGIGEKSQELDALDKNLVAAKTDAERVPILRAEVAAWAEKFSLAEGTIAEKDKQVAAWQQKFDSQAVISESWKARYEDEARLHAISRSEISALKTRLISSRIAGTVKSGLVILGIAAIGYQAIRGK